MKLSFVDVVDETCSQNKVPFQVKAILASNSRHKQVVYIVFGSNLSNMFEH